jgi:outer membrane protein
MRLFFARLVLMLPVLFAPAIVARGEESIDLAAVFKRAEELNASVLTGREAAVQARAAADVQRVALLPNVSLRAQQQRSETVTVADRTAIQNPAVGRFDGQLNGSLSLLNLQLMAAYRSAQRGADAADADADFTLQSILAGAGVFYFTQLRNQERDIVLAANVARAQELLTLAQHQLDAGISPVTQIDVTRAEAQLAQARLAQLQNETTTKQGLQQLLLALDYDAVQPVGLRTTNLLPQTTTSSVALLEIREQAETKFFARRADWRRTQRALEQTGLDEKAASLERAPSVALTGSYGQSGAYFDTDRKDEWAGAVAVTVPVFDGLKSRSDRRTALSKRRVQEIKLHALENQIKAEIDAAEQDVNSRYQQIDVAKLNLRLAEDQLRLARVRYVAGVADNREIIEALNQLALANDNVIEAKYRYNLSRVELARAKGEVRDLLGEKTE